MESPIDHVSPFHWPSFTATLPASPLATSAAAYRPGRCAPLNDGRLAADMLRCMAASHRFFVKTQVAGRGQIEIPCHIYGPTVDWLITKAIMWPFLKKLCPAPVSVGQS